jgi:hypothetical protein
MYKRVLSNFLVLTTLVCLPSIVMAEDTSILKIVSQPKKSVCQSNSVKIGEASSIVELCVLQGMFSHDQYSLNIDKKQIIKGIDDETTRGINITYSGDNLSLTCTPQREAPKDISPQKVEAYQKMMNLSAEDAKRMATLAETVEVGRLCKATLGAILLIEVQVSFE